MEARMQPPAQKIQIYPTSTGEISPFLRDKYERDAKKYWDIFYKRHQDKLFKDRHYLDKELGQYLSGLMGKSFLRYFKFIMRLFFLSLGWVRGWKYHLSVA